MNRKKWKSCCLLSISSLVLSLLLSSCQTTPCKPVVHPKLIPNPDLGVAGMVECAGVVCEWRWR